MDFPVNPVATLEKRNGSDHEDGNGRKEENQESDEPKERNDDKTKIEKSNYAEVKE